MEYFIVVVEFVVALSDLYPIGQIERLLLHVTRAELGIWNTNNSAETVQTTTYRPSFLRAVRYVLSVALILPVLHLYLYAAVC